MQWNPGINTTCHQGKSGLNSGVISVPSHISYWDFWLCVGVYMPFEVYILNIFTIVWDKELQEDSPIYTSYLL